MGAISSALLALKLGLYAPAPWPMAAWFYVSTNLPPDRVSPPPVAVEIGATLEPRKVPHSALGNQGIRIVWRPAYFLGISKRLGSDLDLSAGAKWGQGLGGYAGLSLKFDAVEWREPGG